MNIKNIFQNTDGTSPVVGMILILAIATVSIGIVYTSGIPLIENAKYSTHMTSIQKSFGVLHSDILEVVRGPFTGVGSARVTRLDIDGGSLSVDPSIGQFKVEYPDSSITFIPGTISYDYLGQTVIYENGAVFVKYATFSTIKNDPLIYAIDMGSNTTGLMIHIINITGINSSIGGSGKGNIRTSIEDGGMDSIYSGQLNNVNLTIKSQSYDSWNRYLNKSLSDAGAKYSVTFPASETVQINITRPGGYIQLSMYETRVVSIAG